MSRPFDPYKVLQVDPEADPDVIQAAYRRLAQRFHPDRGGGPEDARRMVILNEAWAIVSDPKRRAALDGERARAAAAESAFTAFESAPPPQASPRGDAGIGATFTSGRSTIGGGYDAATMRAPDSHGAAGPPPGNPSGPALNFGRYAGWTIGEIGRSDPAYLEWLERTPIGRPFREAIDDLLRRAGRRRSPADEAQERRGLFRRR